MAFKPTKSLTRNKTLLPVVMQRAQLADGLARYMNQLGLERRHKVKTLHELLSADHSADTGNGKAEGNAPRAGGFAGGAVAG